MNTALQRLTQAVLTNKSGGSVAQGDVVVIDLTTASSFTITTTSGYVSGMIGVILEPNGIANNASGMVAFSGPVPKINLSGSASLGDLFKTHSVAKQAVGHAAPAVTGDFGQVLGTGTTPAALLFGAVVQFDPVAVNLSGTFGLSGDISPSQITADQNDYNPTGLSGASVLRLNTDALRNMTGLQGGADGRLIAIYNTGSTSLVLKNESASSSAANRFALQADITLAGADGCLLIYDSTSSRWRCIGKTPSAAGGGGSSTSDAYILIRDEKASGSSGGTFTSGAYRTRDLTTKVHDTASLASLASNQITLSAGTYRCRIVCPGFRVNDHKAKLYNITDSADIIIGTPSISISTGNNAVTHSFIVGRFTLAASKTLEVQHRCSTTQSSNGFGSGAAFGDVEVFTVAEFWKEQ